MTSSLLDEPQNPRVRKTQEHKLWAPFAALGFFFFALIALRINLPAALFHFLFFAGAMYLFVEARLPKPASIMLALIAYLPFSRQISDDAVSFPSSHIVIPAAILMLFVSLFIQRKEDGREPWTRSPLDLPLLGFLALGFIAVLNTVMANRAGFPETFGEFFRRWITPVLIYFAALQSLRTKKEVSAAFNLLIFTAALIGLLAIREILAVGEVSNLEKARIGGIANDPNVLAAFLDFCICMPAAFFIAQRKKWRGWLFLIPFALIFRGMLGTFSRGGYLAFATGMFGVAFAYRKRLLIPFLAALVFVAVFPQVLPQSMRERISQTFEKPTVSYDSPENLESSLDRSNRDRIEIWKGSIQMIKEHPFGIGYNQFRYRIAEYWSGRRPFEAHNTYLFTAAEMGIPALLVFLLILGLILKSAWSLSRSKEPLLRMAGMGFFGAMISLMTSFLYVIRLDSIEVSGYVWILAGIMARLVCVNSGGRHE